MKFLKGFWLKFYKSIALQKKRALKTVVAIFLFVLASFLIEYFGFGRHFNQYRFLFILSIGSLISIFFALRKRIGQNPELGFLAVALICGTLLAVSEPKIFVSWDEQIHYKHAEKLASNVVPDMFFRPNTIPSSYSIEEQKKLDALVDSRYKKPATKSRTENLAYNRIGYIPSAIAIAVGNFFRLPYHITFILGRWINLLVYALIIFFAIRKLKSGKMLMSIVALFPTAVFLASNYNYDSWVAAFTMLGLAYLFSELQQPDKKITVREMCIMIGAFVIGLGPKAIYFPLLFLLFLLKPVKFNSPKQHKKFILAAILSILFVVGSFMLPFLANGPGNGDRRGGTDVNATQQVKFILSEPITYAKILLNFTKGYLNPANAGGFMTFFAYLGSLKEYLFILALTTLGIATFTDKNEYDKKTVNWKVRLSIIGAFLAATALIATALYISINPVGSMEIGWVQPRYLIPLVFPLLFILGSSHIKNKLNKNIYNTVIFAIMIYTILQGIWDLIIRNYH